jgi:hypothetical protein
VKSAAMLRRYYRLGVETNNNYQTKTSVEGIGIRSKEIQPITTQALIVSPLLSSVVHRSTEVILPRTSKTYTLQRCLTPSSITTFRLVMSPRCRSATLLRFSNCGGHCVRIQNTCRSSVTTNPFSFQSNATAHHPQLPL